MQPNSGGASTTILHWWRQKPINHVSPFCLLGVQFWDTVHKAFRGSQSQMSFNHCAGQLNHASYYLFLLPYFILFSYTYCSPKSQSQLNYLHWSLGLKSHFEGNPCNLRHLVSDFIIPVPKMATTDFQMTFSKPCTFRHTQNWYLHLLASWRSSPSEVIQSRSLIYHLSTSKYISWMKAFSILSIPSPWAQRDGSWSQVPAPQNNFL